MPFATRLRFPGFRSLALVVAIASLASSCQSTRPSFSFQPMPSQAMQNHPALPPATPAPATEAGTASAPTPSPTPKLMALGRQPRGSAELKPPRHIALAAPLQRVLAATSGRRLVPQLVRKPTTEGAAENGLGRVALFFIGVVLALLAGLAALVNVIFGVGFFTALGYVAAGLVVLALLYVLLSGKKKKA